MCSYARRARIPGPPLLVGQTVDVRLTQETGPDNGRAAIAEGVREPEHGEWQRSFFSSVTEGVTWVKEAADSHMSGCYGSRQPLLRATERNVHVETCHVACRIGLGSGQPVDG